MEVWKIRVAWCSLGLATLLSGCGGAEQRKAVHMEKGLLARDEGKLEKARVEFSSVLQIDPKDVAAHLELGEVHERLQSYRDAMGQYLAVIQLDADNIKARLKAGQMYLLADAYQQAQEQVDNLTRIRPDDPEVLALRGALYLRQNQTERAELDADRLLAMNRASIPAIALKAEILHTRGERLAAVRLLEEGIRTHPAELALRYLLVEIHGNDAVDRVRALFNEMIALDPREMKHRLALSRYLARNKRIDAAEEVLRKAAEVPEHAAEAKLALVELLVTEHRPEHAEPVLQAMLKENPDLPPLWFGLAQLYENSGRFEQAVSIYRDLIQQHKLAPSGLEARTKLAGLFAAAQKFAEAQALVQEVLREKPKDQAGLRVSGKLALLVGDAPLAIANFTTALQDNPDSVELLRGLARAYLLHQEPQLAEEAWKRALRADPKAVNVYLDFAQYLAEQQRTQAAIAWVEDALRIAPKDLAALSSLFQLQVRKNDFSGAQATTETIIRSYPSLPAGYAMSGIVHGARKDYAASVHDFESALRKAPDAIDPLARLINTWLAQGKPAEALQRLDQLLQESPKNFFVMNMKGEVCLAEKRYAAAADAFRKALQLNPQWAVPYRGLALTMLAQGDKAAAIASLREGLDATRHALPLVSDLAQIYLRSAQNEDAIKLYEAVLGSDPKSELAANNLAMLLVDNRTDPASLERAVALAESLDVNHDPAYLDTLGWVRCKRQEFEQAIVVLRNAVAAAPDSALVHYHLGIAYAGAGKRNLAMEQLDMALASKHEFPERQRTESALAELRSQPTPGA